MQSGTKKQSIHILKHLDLIVEYLDYFTLISLKFTNKTIREKISSLQCDRIFDIRNIVIKNENNKIYKVLRQNKNLKRIIIEFRKINDTHVMQIGSDILEELNLNGCHNITNKSLIHISKTCKNLKRLDLYWIPNITDDGLSSIVENLLKLVHLNISGLKNLTSVSLNLIGKNLLELQEINLTRCSGVNDEFLSDLCKNINLKYLNLYALPYLQCDFFEEIGKREDSCKLDFLDLCGGQKINDGNFSVLKNKNCLKNLKYLNLSWCSLITDATFEMISDQLDSLELLSLHGILGITDKTIDYLCSNENLSKKLHTLDIYGCSNVINNEKDYLVTKFPNLTCFRYHF